MTNKASFSHEAAMAAAKNWDRNRKKRRRKVKAIKEGRYTLAETKEHLAQRANHLTRQVKASVSELMSEQLREMVDRPRSYTAEEMDDVLFERILGATTDFLSVDFVARGNDVIRSVGRIVVNPPQGRGSLGTGFMITDQLLMTNEHVLESARDAENSFVEFDFQRGLDGRLLPVVRFELDPDTFFHASRPLDYAIVAVKPTNANGDSVDEFGFLDLNPQLGKITLDEHLNIVQHPRGEMKQIVLRDNRLLDLPENPGFVAHYKGDTEPGSSGSPVFNDAWEVVALHHSGVPKRDSSGNILDVDGNIWRRGDDPARIKWVANEGIRVSSLVRHLDETLRGERQRRMVAPILERLEAGDESDRPDGPNDPTDPPPPPGGGGVTSDNGAVQLTVPLNISVSLGSPSAPAATGHVDLGGGLANGEDPSIPLAEDTPSAQELDDRSGYDAFFLGFHAPMPILSASQRDNARVRQHDDEIELRYMHFTTVMNEARKLAYFSAGNMDRQARFQQNRIDGFRSDPRVRRGVQATNRFYSSNPLDRGHLWRRDAGAWGNSRREARAGNDDSYFWTNIAPQHFIFNQSRQASNRGLRLWGNLENLIAAEAERERQRVSVFCGPVFSRRDPPHRGLKIPKRYWKIVIYENDDGHPSAAGFVLSQSSLLRDMSREQLEEFDFSEFAVFQEPIATIAELTGLDFGVVEGFDALLDANEALDAGETESHFEKRIRSSDDLIL